MVTKPHGAPPLKCEVVGSVAAAIPVVKPGPNTPERDPAAAMSRARTTHAKVAALYLEFDAAGRRPVGALADFYGVHRETVAVWLAECRELRLLRPRDEPQRVHESAGRGAMPRGRRGGWRMEP